MERINARNPFALDQLVDLITVDVSFISITRILPSLYPNLKNGGTILALIKPQFEAKRSDVETRGIVREPMIHAEVLGHVINWSINNGFRFLGLVPSPITGAQGNQEFFILIQRPE
jgi:23S rRNA (cytidine1920-2'-O)/16S rRNA (cytidine1409-2'-O)-methyltransferase